MHAITRFFVDRWQFTFVLFTLLVALGWSALERVPKSEDPITRFPAVGVSVVIPGADAEQMERLVAIPIETALNGLEDVRQITSASRNSACRWQHRDERFGRLAPQAHCFQRDPQTDP